MRKFPTPLSQTLSTDFEKPKTATLRMQAPLRESLNRGNSPAECMSVRPFEIQSFDENVEPKGQGLRHLIRQELELMKKEEQKQTSETLREIRAELSQLRDTLDEKPDRKALDNYLNARLQQLSLETHSKNSEIRGQINHLEKSIGQKLQATQLQLDSLNRQLTGDKGSRKNNTSTDSSKLQMIESNIEFLFERVDALTDNRTTRNVSKHFESESSHNESRNDHFERELHSIRTQLKLEMNELTNGFCALEEELQEYSKQLRQKISTADLNETVEELREKASQSSLAIDKINCTLYELQEERDNTERILSRLQERMAKCVTAVESTVPELKSSIEEQLTEMSAEVEDRFARIISSYNGNFQEIDENNHQLKEMIGEILSINSVLTQKLVGTITNKLDCMTFESTIEHLNEQITSTLCSNTRKIREVCDKEFLVEHELKSLKEVLTNLKHDYERSRNRLRDDQRSSLCESDKKSIRSRKCLREISPLLMSPLLDEGMRFRRNEGMYEAAGGHYNSQDRMPLYATRSVSELEEFQPEGFHIGSYAKIPSLSDELASIS